MRGGKASRLSRPTSTSTSTQSPSSPISRLPVMVKRPRRTSFSSTDSTPSVGGAVHSKTAKVNDHQTTGKAKLAVTQSATSRSATFCLPAASPSSANLDRVSRVGDKIKCRLAINVNISATSVLPATSVPPATAVPPAISVPPATSVYPATSVPPATCAQCYNGYEK